MKKDLVVGRVILDLGLSMSDLNRSPNKWRRHKIQVTKLLKDGMEYRQRLSRIIRLAKREKIEILLLPACALATENLGDFRHYKKMLTDVPWVVAGRLSVTEEGGSGRFNETASVWHWGRRVAHFDSSEVIWLQMGRVSAMVAISSTIRMACDGEVRRSSVYPPRAHTGILALDMGHHQYSTRYLKALATVQRILGVETSRSHVILSFWKWMNSSSKTSWTVPQRHIGRGFKRLALPSGDGINSDFLDVIEIK
jgi:hypothetical protein